jgi:hypothetical protein
MKADSSSLCKPSPGLMALVVLTAKTNDSVDAHGDWLYASLMVHLMHGSQGHCQGSSKQSQGLKCRLSYRPLLALRGT